MTSQYRLPVAVVIERTAAPNRWQDWSFSIAEVVPDEGIFGSTPRQLHDDGKVSRWLHPGFVLELFPDECKGYFLNLTSGAPSWFVSWLVDGNEVSTVQITGVGVSYIEADRRLTADEQVDTLPLAPELCEWLRLFTNEHFRPDTPRKVRAMSFLSPQEREQQVQQDTKAVLPPPTDPQARNAALREMFHSDPHFRQSDGLEVSVAEVFEVEGSASGRQRKIEQARALGLLDDELIDQPPPEGGPPSEHR